MPQNSLPPLIRSILEGLSDLKAENATVLDLRSLDNSVCDYFVIANAQSNTQIKAMSQSAQKRVREECQDKPWHVEGEENGEWILLDYVSTVVHLFSGENRSFYDLESLWGDGIEINIDLTVPLTPKAAPKKRAAKIKK